MKLASVFVLIFLVCKTASALSGSAESKSLSNQVQLYWFIPDGFRAEAVTMNIYKWASEGELPNIRWMMEHGAYGYSIPVFPGHTPTNTATLVTGVLPMVHGVADLNMHLAGDPLDQVSLNGFSSLAKKVPPIWYTLESLGRKVALLSMPGSTPPEIQHGIVVRGRWGGWGLEFPAVVFQSAPAGRPEPEMVALGGGLLNKNVILKNFVSAHWKMKMPKSYSPAQETTLENFHSVLYAYLYDSKDDGRQDFDRVLLSLDKSTVFADIAVGEWSAWKTIPMPQGLELLAKASLIQAGPRGSLRLRLFYDNLNATLVVPPELNAIIHEEVGPMVDFVDNFPPQLIHELADKKAFLKEAKMSTDWHKKMARFLMLKTKSQIVLHDIYTPNQMLTSRWWLPYLDPKSKRYREVSEQKRRQLWSEVKEMYRQIDGILGEIISHAGQNTYIVLSSDHGVIPLDKELWLNNLFAKAGLLKFKKSSKMAPLEIDWKNTQAVFLQMTHVFINPKGLAGPYHPARGPEMERLQARVIQLLSDLKDKENHPALAEIITRGEAQRLDLPADRVGDLILTFHPGFGGSEGISEDLEIFKNTLKGGYKQGVASKEGGMSTPFMIVGPKIKKGFRLQSPIQHQDQYPTLMYLLGEKSPSFVQGRVLKEIIENP